MNKTDRFLALVMFIFVGSLFIALIAAYNRSQRLKMVIYEQGRTIETLKMTNKALSDSLLRVTEEHQDCDVKENKNK